MSKVLDYALGLGIGLTATGLAYLAPSYRPGQTSSGHPEIHVRSAIVQEVSRSMTPYGCLRVGLETLDHPGMMRIEVRQRTSAMQEVILGFGIWEASAGKPASIPMEICSYDGKPLPADAYTETLVQGVRQ